MTEQPPKEFGRGSQTLIFNSEIKKALHNKTLFFVVVNLVPKLIFQKNLTQTDINLVSEYSDTSFLQKPDIPCSYAILLSTA